MKISGFTFARNAVKLQYPIVESIRSILPIVDESIVVIGDGEDATTELVRSIGDPKVRIIPSQWNPNMRAGGYVLAQQTNIGLFNCTGEWAIYLQADEVLHEAELPALRAALQRYRTGRVEALSLRYFHFFSSYRTYKDDPLNWYRRATRIIRTGVGIESVGDACAFMCRQDGTLRRPRRRDLGVHVYHYGRVRPPDQMFRKQRNLERLYHDESWLETHGLPADMDLAEVYGDARHLRTFHGTHPAVMRDRVASADWPSPRVKAGPWPEWMRRGYVHAAWILDRGLAFLGSRR